MTELITSLQDLKTAANEFTISLQTFLDNTKLSGLLNGPIDHLAIKAKDTAEYEDFIAIFVTESESLSYAPIKNRRLATAKLKKSISFGEFGTCQDLEIMEPKPEKIGKTLHGFEHIEIYYPDFEKVLHTLKENNISFSRNDDPHHKSIVVQINDIGQEIKYTNKHLSDIVKDEMKEGRSIIIK